MAKRSVYTDIIFTAQQQILDHGVLVLSMALQEQVNGQFASNPRYGKYFVELDFCCQRLTQKILSWHLRQSVMD